MRYARKNGTRFKIAPHSSAQHHFPNDFNSHAQRALLRFPNWCASLGLDSWEFQGGKVSHKQERKSMSIA